MFGEAFEIYLIVRETRWRRSRGREGAGAIASPAVRLVSPVSRLAFVVALAVCLVRRLRSRCGPTRSPGIFGESQTAGAAQAEEVIALPDIATRATEVTDLIRGSKAKLAASPGLQTISESLPATVPAYRSGSLEDRATAPAEADTRLARETRIDLATASNRGHQLANHSD